MRESFADTFVGDEWPDLLDAERSADYCVLYLAIGPQLKWLQGHFPNQPVLAGVVQTHWACSLAAKIFSVQSDMRRIDNLKFQNVILPPQNVRLELSHTARHEKAVNDVVSFRYVDTHSPTHIFSEGKLVF